MTESDIRQAYARIRKVDNTIPDEVLDFMKDCALAEIKRQEEARRQKRRDRLDAIQQDNTKCRDCGAEKPKCGNDGTNWQRLDCEYDEHGNCIHCGRGIPF